MSDQNINEQNKNKDPKALNDIYMDADTIEQFNTNQQSNMTLSAHSIVNQSHSAVKINNS